MAQAQPSSSYQFDEDEELLESEDDVNDLVTAELGGPVQSWPEEVAMRVQRNFASMSSFIPYARVAVEDLKICLRASRKLLRQRGEPYTHDHLAALQYAQLLAMALHWSTMSSDRIFRMDSQAQRCPGRVCKLVIEYTIFIPVLLKRVQDGDLNNANSLEAATIIPCLVTFQTLLNHSSDLHMLYVQPSSLEALLNSGYSMRLRAMAWSLYDPGEVQPDVENLNLTSTQAFLTDLFCRVGGLASLAEVTQKLSPCNLANLQQVLQLICEMDANVLDAASQAPEGTSMYNHVAVLQQELDAKCTAMLGQIQTDPECLSERERTFSLLSRVFESMFQARCNLGNNAPAVRIAANKDVSEMQRAFVLRMLRSTNFNNLLSAAREANRMLSRAVELSQVDDMEALKSADAWLSEHQVIQTLLKANLHQRQYADLVLSILQVLTRFGMVRTEHLDMLWAVTETEGTFDVVKANVYAMIQDLAADLATDLLEVLFKKFEVLAAGRSMSDSVRLLDLLKKLATSNSAKPQGPGSTSVTAERLLSLIWKLTVPTDTAPEMLAADAIADVLRAYGVQGHMLYCKQYLGLCCRELQLHQNVVTSLRVLRRLLALYELFDQERDTTASMQAMEGVGSSAQPESLCQSVLMELDAEFDLQKLLVCNTLGIQAEARAVLQARPTQAQAHKGGPVLPGYGKYHYGTVLHEYLTTISYVASKQKSYYDQTWAEQLWDALVKRPLLPIDSELGLQWVADGASSQLAEFLSHTTKAALLDARITKLPVGSLSLPAWQVFQQYFIKVNLEEKKLELPEVREGGIMAHATNRGLTHMQVLCDDGLHGRDFMWQAALNADHPDVATQAAELLIQVYIRGSKGMDHEAQATATFIRLCADACMQNAELLAGINDPAQWSSLAGAPVPAVTSGQERTHPSIVTMDVTAAAPCAPVAAEDTAHAVRNVQRCLFLMHQAAETGQLPSLPLQASHQATTPAANIDLDILLPASSPGASQLPRRVRQSVNLVDTVGMLRRWLARELHVEPQYIRLLSSGVEWKNDAHLLRQVLTRPDHARLPILQVLNSPAPNSYSAPGDDYAARWQATAIAQLAKEPHLYHMLLYMVDQPQWPQLCRHASALLQQLPTCSEVHAAVKDALSLPHERAHSVLRGLLLHAGHRSGMHAPPSDPRRMRAAPASPILPARLTYWLQVLRALVSPPNMLSQQLAEQESAMAVSSPTTADARRSSPQPSASAVPHDIKARVATLSACLSVLQETLTCAAHPMQLVNADECSVLVQQHQLLSLHTEMVQLLSQLCSNKELLAVMQNAVKVHGVRPQPLDQALMISPANSPSLGTVGTPGLSTPTGALQALSVAGQEADVDSTVTEPATGSTGAVAVVAAFAPDPAPLVPEQTCDMEGMVTANEGGGSNGSNYASALSGDMEGIQLRSDGGAAPAAAVKLSEGGAPGLNASSAVAVVQQQQQSSGVVLLGLLLHACCQAVQLASSVHAGCIQQQEHTPASGRSLCNAASNTGSNETSRAAVLSEWALITQEAAAAARDGLSALKKLLNHLPDLYTTFLTHPRSPLLVSDLLLCPHSDAVRATAFRVLRDVCLPSSGISNEEASATCYAWLLRQLLECRSRVTQSHAGGLAACKDYAVLLQEVVNLLPKMQQLQSSSPRSSPGPYELASQLLEQEVAVLHACLSPYQQAINRLDLVPENPGPGFTYLTLATPAGQQELEGRLKLVACLVRALDRSGNGDVQQQELITLLFRRYLFPECVLTVVANTGEPGTKVPPWLSHGASGWCATDPGARQAAYELVVDLMSSSSTNMACGITQVMELHGSHAPLRLSCGYGYRKVDLLEPLREAGVYCGLRNGGATCYMNAVIQQLFMQPQVRKMLLAATPSTRSCDHQDDNELLFGQLQLLMAYLALSCASSIRPEFFWDSIKDYDGQPIDIKEHQDAHEFFTRLQDSVDSHMRATGQPCALASVFGGKFVQQIISREGSYRSEREEEFYQISVDVKGKGTLQNSLASYVQGELMEGENAWLCEELGRKVAATRRMAIKSLPHTLVIHLKRFEYDHMANQRYKVRERLEFPSTLDMYPYTAEALAASEPPQTSCSPSSGTSPTGDTQPAGSREDAMALPGTTDMTEDSMDSSTGADSETTDSCAKQQSHAKHMYELRGVVVHSGSAFAGHYYSFIQERPQACTATDGQRVQIQPGRWFKFDDRNVTPWDPAQLDEQCFGGPINTSMGGASNSSMSLDGTGNHPPPDRAYSAFLLFYDRVGDTSCDEAAAAPTFIPTNPYAASPSSPMVATHGVKAGTVRSCAGAHPAEAAAAAAGHLAEDNVTPSAGDEDQRVSAANVAAVPYNMSMDLYCQVMNANLDLLRRVRAFEKDYLVCIRKVCELRLERSMRSGRKARRTRLLGSGGSDANMGSQDACLSPDAAAAGTAAQDAAAQREQERQSAQQAVIKLSLEYIIYVIMYVPPTWTEHVAVLEHFRSLYERLMSDSQDGSASLRALAMGLCEHAPQVCEHLTTRAAYVKAKAMPWLFEQLIEPLQPKLALASQQACAQELFYDAADDDMGAAQGEPSMQVEGMYNPRDIPIVVLHAEFLHQLAFKPILEQYKLILQPQHRHNRGSKGRGTNPADVPFIRYEACFKMLGTAVSLLSPGVALLPQEWPAVVLDAVKLLVWALPAGTSQSHNSQTENDLEEVLSAAISCLVQILSWVEKGHLVFPLNTTRVTDPDDPDLYPCQFSRYNLYEEARGKAVYPSAASDVEGGPLGAQHVHMNIMLDAKALRGLAADSDTEPTLFKLLLRRPGLLNRECNLLLLRLLCWNDGATSLAWLHMWMAYMYCLVEDFYHQPDAPLVDMFLATCDALLVIPDQLDLARRQACLRVPIHNPHVFERAGIIPMLDASVQGVEDGDIIGQLAWVMLAFVINEHELEDAWTRWRRREPSREPYAALIQLLLNIRLPIPIQEVRKWPSDEMTDDGLRERVLRFLLFVLNLRRCHQNWVDQVRARQQQYPVVHAQQPAAAQHATQRNPQVVVSAEEEVPSQQAPSRTVSNASAQSEPQQQQQQHVQVQVQVEAVVSTSQDSPGVDGEGEGEGDAEGNQEERGQESEEETAPDKQASQEV